MTRREYNLLWAVIFIVLALGILLIFLVNAYASDPVILNLKWQARGDYNSYRIKVKDPEGYIYDFNTTAEEIKLDLDSGVEYDVELSGRDIHTGNYTLLQSMKWQSRVRAEGVFSEVK